MMLAPFRGLFDEIGHSGEIDPGRYEIYDRATEKKLFGHIFVDGTVVNVVMLGDNTVPTPNPAPNPRQALTLRYFPDRNGGMDLASVISAAKGNPGYRHDRYIGTNVSSG